MKRIISLVLVLVLALSVLALTSCGNKTTKLTIGATPSPHAEILEYAKTLLAKEGVELDIRVFNDYVLPNTAVENNELDANYFQHKPYLNNFNSENGTHLVSVGEIHYEPFGLYAGKTKTLEGLKAGATIAIPNDGTNEARALLLLADNGLITLKSTVKADTPATKLDIEDAKGLNIVELEAAQLPAQLASVDAAVINGNYAISAGLKVKDALAVEQQDSDAAATYVNVIAVKAGNENNEAVKKLVEVLKSDAVKKWIEEKYDGAVLPF